MKKGDRVKKILLQKCMICNYKMYWYPTTKEDEDKIRAACLPCGHQGLFTLEKVNSEKLKKIKSYTYKGKIPLKNLIGLE